MSSEFLLVRMVSSYFTANRRPFFCFRGKSSDYAEDEDVSELCGSTPPHLVRYPAQTIKITKVHNFQKWQGEKAVSMTSLVLILLYLCEGEGVSSRGCG